MSTTTNGRAQRTSLAQQIDRLDLILDNLSEGLQEAVAEAVKTAVNRAVEAALVEVLTNPELRRHLNPEPPVAQVRKSESFWSKAAGFALSCWTTACWAVGALRSVAQVLVGQALVTGQSVTQRARWRLTSVARQIWCGAVDASRFFRQMRRSLVVALGIGLMVGVGCFVAGPMVASAVSGFAGFVVSLATVVRLRWLVNQADRGQEFDGRVL